MNSKPKDWNKNLDNSRVNFGLISELMLQSRAFFESFFEASIPDHKILNSFIGPLRDYIPDNKDGKFRVEQLRFDEYLALSELSPSRLPVNENFVGLRDYLLKELHLTYKQIIALLNTLLEKDIKPNHETIHRMLSRWQIVWLDYALLDRICSDKEPVHMPDWESAYMIWDQEVLVQSFRPWVLVKQYLN